MTTAKKIKQMVAGFPDDFVFVAADLDCDYAQMGAAAKALQRLAYRGEISKLGKGKYFKPRKTIFGVIKPSPLQIAKQYLVQDGKTVGYLTGPTAFSQFSLTTQISSEIQIGTNFYRRPLRIGIYKISFIPQMNVVSECDIDILRLLDCLRYIKVIPGTTSDEACKRLICVIRGLKKSQRLCFVEYALKYKPFVRALAGAILEYIGGSDALISLLRQSLNGVSKYRLSISEATLPTKQSWRIYEPTL